MTTIYLARHASHDRLNRVLCGRMPGVALSPRGRAEAAALAVHFKSSSAVAVMTSPMERARQTAAAIAEALGLAVTVAPELNEIDLGDWSGSRFDQLASDPLWRRWNVARTQSRPPRGETMGEARARIVGLLERLRDADAGPTILVSHGDIIKGALLSVLGLPLDAVHLFDIDPASVSAVALWPGGGKVLHLNTRVAGRDREEQGV
jgi:broad specificity phosphatase PhoE